MNIRKTPFKLPEAYQWSDCDLMDDQTLDDVYRLLLDSYIESGGVKQVYTREFLRWSVCRPAAPPHVIDVASTGDVALPEVLPGSEDGPEESKVATPATPATPSFPLVFGIRLRKTGKLIAFISGVEIMLSCKMCNRQDPGNSNASRFPAIEVNYLCTFKEYRGKRMAPVLIKEMARRGGLRKIWHAVYTAAVPMGDNGRNGTQLVKKGSMEPQARPELEKKGREPSRFVAETAYHHRPIDVKAMIASGFIDGGAKTGQAQSSAPKRVDLNELEQIFRVNPSTISLRPMTKNDVPRVTALLNQYLCFFHVHPVVTQADVEHQLLSRPGIVQTYVHEVDGVVADMISFIDRVVRVTKQAPQPAVDFAASHPSARSVSGTIPTREFQFIAPATEVTELKCSELYYHFESKTALPELVSSALALEQARGVQCINALEIMGNGSTFEKCLFVKGTGELYYFLYNWFSDQVQGDAMGLVPH